MALGRTWIFCGVLVTLTTNQPGARRSNSDSSKDTSYVSPSESRTCRIYCKDIQQIAA